MTIAINSVSQGAFKVDQRLFGANALFQIDDINDGQFAENAEFFNSHGIRWPGGSITEAWFDPRHPDEPLSVPRREPQKLDHDEVLTFTEVMKFGEETGRPVTIVLPTIHLLKNDGSIDKAALSDIRGFVKTALAPGGAYADAKIAAFEMGNEYWSEMTAKEYGKILNAIVKEVDLAIKQSGAGYQPKILAQVGDGWGPDYTKGGEYHGKELTWGQILEQSNKDIIDQLDGKARGLINGLIDHFYPDMHQEVSTWSSLKRQDVWSDNGMDLDLNFTEWNVKSSTPLPEGLPVFAQGAAFAETFEAMVRMKAGSAFVWPVNHSTRTDLGGKDGAGGGHLSITGGVFKLLSENVRNLSLTGLTIENSNVLETSLYQSASKSVLFLSRDDGNSYSDSLDLRRIAAADPGSGAILKITEQRVIRDVSEDEFVGRDAGAEIITVRSGRAADLASWSVQMSAYEVTMIKIEWVMPPTGSAIIGGAGQDRLNGTSASELIRGLSGHDTLSAGSGNDTVDGGDGRDYLIGGLGNDSLRGGADNDTIRGDGGRDRLRGDAGNDNLQGGADHDVLAGGAGSDTIDGGTGDDQITGDSGADRITAGAGNDRADAGTGNDIVNGGAGNDTLSGGAQHDSLSGEDGADILYGNDGNDTLKGGTGNDVLKGGSGNDKIYGGTGNDRITGDAGADRITAGAGNDRVDAGIGNDIVNGGAGDDNLRGGAQNDILSGEHGADILYGNDGNDTLRGGTGNDVLKGGSGNDRIYGDDGNDSIVCGTGMDYAKGGSGNDTLDGSSGNDSLDGGAGNDNLIGGAGNDTLYGGAGNDTLMFGSSIKNGGAGIDSAFGGGGADVFVFKGTSGWTGIRDFSDGVDKICFAGKEIDSIDDLRIIQVSHGGISMIRIDYTDEMGGGTIRLEAGSGDLLMTQITASDFIF